MVGVLGLRLAGQGILGDVDVHRAWSAGAGDVEGLGDDARDVVRLAHEVVVLGHRQGDAADVDLLEGVLADERAGHVAGDGDDGHRVELGGGDAGDEVGGAGAAGAETDADPAAGPSVAVGSVRGSLLVTDEDGAQLWIVGPDVVERQDDAAGVAEDDIDALADERLAERVGADARAASGLLSRSMSLRAFSMASAAAAVPALGTCRPRVAATASRPAWRRRARPWSRWLRRPGSRSSSRWS